MADGKAKPVIFISYSHKDRLELEYIRSHLAPVEQLGTLTVWDDNNLQLGDDWKGDINSALDVCRVFILIVSRHSLASKFIRTVEIARVLGRRQTELIPMCPIIATPCHMDGINWLDDVNRRPKDGKALSELPEAVRDREMTAIVADLVDIVTRLRAAQSRTAETPSNEGPRQAPSLGAIDYARLPETPYKNLVGRDDELTTLDEAWADKLTNIVSLVAWGGAGKSALVNEWLKRLRDDNYRGAAAVLGWSFYSQGTKERTTSAEGFLDWALGKLDIKSDATSATIKAELIVDAISRRRVLMVLDGIEPLQYGPGGQLGQLKDQGLRVLLRRFAATPPATTHGLIVVTSRLEIRDIHQWRCASDKAGSALVIDLGRLSDDAGAELLADNGVRGASKEMRTASHEFEGHALALNLLASFLARRHHGDIKRRDRIGPLLQNSDARGHDHARRVMQAYEAEWLKDEPVLSAILHVVGLFDRPASTDCLAALRRAPAIEGLTGRLVGLTSDQWADAISALREVHLLDPEDPTAPGALDAHPLVREWFGERLKQISETAWKTAHGRLYEYLRDTTKEGITPTLEDLGPLFQAIAHGCRADRHQEALDKIYVDRVCRRMPSGRIEFYVINKLGAIGSVLIAMSWFFEKPFETPVKALQANDQMWVLGEAGSILSTLGRFTDALPALRSNLSFLETQADWANAAVCATNLSEAELAIGEIAGAISAARDAVKYGDKTKINREIVLRRAVLADALHAAGQRDEADQLFAESELLQQEPNLESLGLRFVQGRQRCDLLLATGQSLAAREHAVQTLEFVREHHFLLDIALDTLTLGRAELGFILTGSAEPHLPPLRHGDAATARAWLDEGVDALRTSGHFDELPRGLLARSRFRRNVGDWNAAARDLDEVEEIAEPGPMRLFLCDMAIERARLAFAQIEAFAPLNGTLEKENLPKPTVPNAEEIAKLKGEIEKKSRSWPITLKSAATTGATKNSQSCEPCCAARRNSRICRRGCDCTFAVMAGLVPAIHVFASTRQ